MNENEERKAKRSTITTRDNPYNPLKDWDSWYNWDESHGYHTCQLVDRLSHIHDSMTDEEVRDELNETYDKICNLLFMVYKIIDEDQEPTPEKIEITSS